MTVELTPEEAQMIKDCLPFSVTTFNFLSINSNAMDLASKYSKLEAMLPDLLSKLQVLEEKP